ncbi:MAG: Flp family type IVb pilin [Rhodanobacter sp.]
MNMSIGKFLREEDGITALEYGILAALVAAVLVGVFKTRLETLFGSLMDALTTKVATASS